jgi:hypothetical protein
MATGHLTGDCCDVTSIEVACCSVTYNFGGNVIEFEIPADFMGIDTGIDVASTGDLCKHMFGVIASKKTFDVTRFIH